MLKLKKNREAKRSENLNRETPKISASQRAKKRGKLQDQHENKAAQEDKANGNWEIKPDEEESLIANLRLRARKLSRKAETSSHPT